MPDTDGPDDARQRLPAMYRQRIEDLDRQLAALRSREVEVYRGNEDATADAIANAERMRDAYLAALDREEARQ